MTEAEVIRATVAAGRVYDSATKLLCFIDIPQAETYRAALLKDLKECAAAFGYDLTARDGLTQ